MALPRIASTLSPQVLQEERGSGTAYLLSSPADRYGCRSHMFLLVTDSEIRSLISEGFASGYGGEGPAGLTRAILLLDSRGWNVKEIHLSQRDFECVADRAVTDETLETILALPHLPSSEAYLYAPLEAFERSREVSVWQDLPVAIPLPLIDRRLLDVAHSFWDDPDAALNTAYRRLEDTVRERSGINDHGARLFRNAFGTDKSPLVWDHDGEESKVFTDLFVGAFSGFRNSRAHREQGSSDVEAALEFLQLNMLYMLEAKLRTRTDTPKQESA